ncbi:MAG: glycosyltransferase [Haloechinothrix sp.]
MRDRQPRIRHNEYTVLTPAAIGTWQPTLSVSVVIPAWNCQEKLDLTLAGLAAQTYPDHLLDVIVVDDGSDPPLRLPEVRPQRTRLVPGAPGGWGIAHATNTGVRVAVGDIVHRLDSDMVLYPDHIEAQMRWHHLANYLVLLGAKRFVDFRPGELTSDQVYRAGIEARTGELFDVVASAPHEWVERIIDETDGLRSAGADAFRVLVGASVSLPRRLYHDVGGMDTELVHAEDSEIGYRLAQAGAVFIPDPDSRSWHLGASTMMTTGEAIQRHSVPFKVDRMAQPRWKRKAASGQWSVPFIDVVVDVAAGTYEQNAAAFDRILAGSFSDVRITAIGSWGQLTDERRSVPADPLADLRLLRARFRGDGRVRFTDRVEATSAPVPFRLTLDPTWAPHPYSLRDLTRLADEEVSGLVVVSGPSGAVARLERTAAVSRAMQVQQGDADLDTVIDAVFGARTTTVDDARLYPLDQDGKLRRPPDSDPVPRSETELFRGKARSANRKLKVARERNLEFERANAELLDEVRRLRTQVDHLRHQLRSPWLVRSVQRVARRLVKGRRDLL